MAKFAPSPSGFISGPWTDGLFLIGAPLWAALIYLPFHLSPVMNYPLGDAGSFYYASSLKNAFMGVVISSHLVIVFARSYANAEIFRMHPLRFTVVPAVLFAAMIGSPAFLASVGILAIWWDVYHSSLQTFGIGRIYDGKRGNDTNAGRRLDLVLALLIYAGPILGGASLFLHIANHDRYRVDAHGLPMAFFDRVPAAANQYAAWLTWGLLAFAIPFCAYYVYAYWRLHQKGYRVSLQKVLLLVALTPVSLVCWGFNSFSEAFFVMNFLHSWQYFFLVWHTEGDNLTSRLRLDGWRFGKSAALSIFLFLAVGFGVWATLPLPAIQFSGHTMLSILMLVAILHFWYDGFIWSVRRGHVHV